VQTAVTQYHESSKSNFQFVEIIDTSLFGKCLVLDGHMQSSQKDEHLYHESLVHIAMLSHECPKRVFIGGGGEGATLREVLRHASVESAVMVDIDQIAVEVSMKHLTTHHRGSFTDARTTLVYDDAKAWLERYTGPAFDVMIFDLSDPLDDGSAAGPATQLYTAKFYEFCKTRLGEGGVFVTQAGPAGYFTKDQVRQCC
jgi:spermidine synthase